MPNAGFRALVPPIYGEPSPHGLLGGCIPVVTSTDRHQLMGTDLLPAGCGPANPWVDCPPDDYDNPAAKVFDRPEACSFEPVTAYAGIECSTIGMSFEELREAAVQQLVRGEQQVLEAFFMARWLADDTHTTDLTPGAGAVHIVNGVGLLETWLSTNYGGGGVIHAPIGTAALMSQNFIVPFPGGESCPETLAGNNVVLGGGYSANLGPATFPAPPVPAPEGEAWLYITPPMRIRRDVRSTPQRSVAQGINTSINDLLVLAESTFVAEVACCRAAAVRVTLSACC